MTGFRAWVDARGVAPEVSGEPEPVRIYLMGEGDGGDLIFATLHDGRRPTEFMAYGSACHFLADARARGVLKIGPVHIEEVPGD